MWKRFILGTILYFYCHMLRTGIDFLCWFKDVFCFYVETGERKFRVARQIKIWKEQSCGGCSSDKWNRRNWQNTPGNSQSIVSWMNFFQNIVVQGGNVSPNNNKWDPSISCKVNIPFHHPFCCPTVRVELVCLIIDPTHSRRFVGFLHKFWPFSFGNTCSSF